MLHLSGFQSDGQFDGTGTVSPELFTQSDRRSGRCRALDVSSMMLQAIS
jgi:hypothetical protein